MKVSAFLVFFFILMNTPTLSVIAATILDQDIPIDSSISHGSHDLKDNSSFKLSTPQISPLEFMAKRIEIFNLKVDHELNIIRAHKRFLQSKLDPILEKRNYKV